VKLTEEREIVATSASTLAGRGGGFSGELSYAAGHRREGSLTRA
jgi:hypothetical protein